MALIDSVTGFALIAFACLSLYQFCIHPIMISPLRKVPSASPLASLTPLWILYKRYKSQELATINEAHERLGPVIRLAPNEIAVNCVKGGIQSIYTGGFEKHEWYPNAFNNYGVSNMFSMIGSRPHSIRKRMISNIYSKSYLQNSASLSAIASTVLYDRLLPRLSELAKAGEPADMYLIFNSTTFDFVSGYLYGLSCGSNMLQREKTMQWFLELYHARGLAHRYFWIQELPRLTRFLKRFGIDIVPKRVWAAHHRIEAIAMGYSHCAEMKFNEMETSSTKVMDTSNTDETSSDEAKDIPIVYTHIAKAMGISSVLHENSGADCEKLRREIASELTDHLIAGFETSGITLTYIAYELSQRPKLQAALRKELLSLNPAMIAHSDGSPSTVHLPLPKLLDALPLLEAIVKETLRLHAAIPGPQPRVTPASGCTLGPKGEYTGIPGGVRISAQAWSLHRNAEVFPEPEAWIPERWMSKASKDEEKRKAMDRWFWAFGSGGRMCVGSNLAIHRKLDSKFKERCRYRVLTGSRDETYYCSPVHELPDKYRC